MIDASPVSLTMNAYCDVAFADAYFAFRYGADAWADFTTEQKEALIVSATNEIETFKFGGLKTSRTQPLQWPRSSLYDLNGDPIPSGSLPRILKNAALEYAFWMWTEEDRYLSDTDVDQVESYKVGPLTVKAKAGASSMPSKVIAMINSIGDGVLINTGTDGTGPQSMNMVL